MKKRRYAKILSVVLTTVTIVCNCFVVEVKADKLRKDATTTTTYTGSATEEVFEELRAEGFDLDKPIAEKVDLSETIYMPDITLQVGGSCAAFATTYYQYSYEANKKNGITSKEQAKEYSPYYTYTYVNDGDDGSNMIDLYKKLQKSGCVEYNHFGPYKEYMDIEQDDIENMRNALSMRIDHFYEYTEEYKLGEKYTVEEKVEVAKKLLSNGIMLVGSYNTYQVWTTESIDGQTDVVFRGGEGELGSHAVAIVGYDDNLKVDIDGDGLVDAQGAFKVANSWGTREHNQGYFWVLYDAVVNLYDLDIEADGEEMYIPYAMWWSTNDGKKHIKYEVQSGDEWIMKEEVITKANVETIIKSLPCIPTYNTTNHELGMFKYMISTYFGDYDDLIDDCFRIKIEDMQTKLDARRKENNFPSNWKEVVEAYGGVRTRMFDENNPNSSRINNWYGFITVKPYDVSVVGQIDYQLKNRSDYQVTFSRIGSGNIIKPTPRRHTMEEIEASEVFDLSELCKEREQLLGEQQWKMTVKIGSGNDSQFFDFSLTDDKGNIIAIPTSGAISEWYVNGTNQCKDITIITNIQMADVNYDGIFDKKDIEIFRTSINGSLDYSYLQKQLMDLNQNGDLDEDDIHKMIAMVYEALFFNPDEFVQNIEKKEFDNILVDFGYVYDKDLTGDLNGDYIINGKDLDILQKVIRGKDDDNQVRPDEYADINQDGVLNQADSLMLGSQIGFIDLNGDTKRNFNDICIVFEHIQGFDLTDKQRERADFNADGKVDYDDMYIMVYGYYANKKTNPDYSEEQFYRELFPALEMHIGDLTSAAGYDEYDVQLIKDVYYGNIISYRYLMLADINQDMVLDEEDLKIYEKEYMSDIPFIYTVDENTKTMILTGVKNNSVTCIKVKDTYTINRVQYTVTALGENAFSQCVDLEEIYLPDTITQIPGTKSTQSPFYGIENYALKIYYEGATIPEGFGQYWNDNHAVALDYSVKAIEDYFYYTADAESRTLTITGIKGEWYQESQTVIIDDRYLVNGVEYRVTAIGDYAFNSESDIAVVELPAGITVIGAWAFAEMPFLTNVYLERCVHLYEIKASAFAYCTGLEEIWIPASVEIIHSDTVEEGIIYNSLSRMDVFVEVSEAKEGWGPYWNYLDEVTVADTTYLQATAS